MAKPKHAGKSIKKQALTLDKNDPRVRAIAVELLDDAFKKSEAQRAERAEKVAVEQATNRMAQARKETKKRKSHKSIVSRLGKIVEPLRAIHDTAEIAFAGDDHETALIVASNLSMLCLKRLEDCLEDLGDYKRGNGDAWLAGHTL
jgi:Xaa-Pro aminopeptidase